MVILILGVLAVGTALIVLSVVPVLPGIGLLILGLVGALALGNHLDRDRRGMRDHAASFDADRGVMASATTFAIPSLSASSREDDLRDAAAGARPPRDAPARD